MVRNGASREGGSVVLEGKGGGERAPRAPWPEQFSRGAGGGCCRCRRFRATERWSVSAGELCSCTEDRAKMPPKKREKDLDGQKGPRMDQIQADHELFLQAFESK